MEQNTGNDWSNSLTNGTPLQNLVSKSSPKPVAKPKAGNRLPMMHVGSGYRYGNLTWFPVWTDEAIAPRRYATAAGKKFTVSEVAQASVQSLQVDNQAEQDLLLLEGMILEGGWQHRALTRSVFIPARAQAQIPVVCVEQNRWGGVSEQAAGKKLAPTAVRVAMRGLSRDNRGNVSQNGADQSRVWGNVAGYQTRLNASAPTQSLADMQDQIKNTIASLPKIEPLPGQRGVVVAAMGQPIAFELFDHPDTMAERLEGMLESYLMDVLDKNYTQVRSQLARDFVYQVSKLKLKKTEEVRGSARSQSVNSRYVAAESVSLNGSLVHLSCINSQHELVLAA
jgi:hypothetical protein